MSAPEPPDPVAARRLRIGRVVGVAKRVGYLGPARRDRRVLRRGAHWAFPAGRSRVTIAGLVVAIVVLPLPIILGYGIRAAEREERGGGGFIDRPVKG